MNKSKTERLPLPVEPKILAPSVPWFDPVGIRFFINTTKRPVKIGFSHNIRAVEMIAILDMTNEDLKTEKDKSLKGEIIEEDVYDL